MSRIWTFDTTLRDGAQGAGVSFSLEDKLAIARELDAIGIDYIEGGYAVSNPKEMAFFHAIPQLNLAHARVVAFGNTRRADTTVQTDPSLKAIVDANTPVVALVGKSWDLHVRVVLKTSLEENLNMIRDSVAYLTALGKEVVFDAEHFFDGYKNNRDYALACLDAAEKAGAQCLALCDTNGGTLTDELRRIVAEVVGRTMVKVGIHVHNDSDLATANTLAAVQGGAVHVQGTINGLGERTGNADLCAVIANLTLKMGHQVLPGDNVRKLTELSRYFYEVANLVPRDSQPFVGMNAFAHKGGLHVNAVQKDRKTYEHVEPEAVGNERRILISELSGRSNVLAKVHDDRLLSNPESVKKILTAVQNLENEGYQFEAAEASFDLLVRKITGNFKPHFELEKFTVMVDKRADDKGMPLTEATVKLRIGDNSEHTAGEGNGPVNALDAALRKGLEKFYPALKDMRLIDYKVRVTNPRAATEARVRVIIESRDHDDIWSTVGVSENIIEASWIALVDSFEYKLTKDEQQSGAKA
jgi:2-isopropylmalate synthase